MFNKLMNYRTIWLSLSMVIAVLSIAAILLKGFNYGIDFTGGSLLDLQFGQPVAISEVRDVMEKHGYDQSVIQVAGADQEANGLKGSNIFIRTQILEEDQRSVLLDDMEKSLGTFEILRIEKVGATVGGELAKNALIAFGLSVVFMLLFISFRFQFWFAISGVIALVYNLLVTMGIYSFLEGPVDANFIAAILTILGFSINDTIVIFDRLRENLKSVKPDADLVEIANFSIHQTLRRSIYTVLIVLFTTISLYLFGGDTTKDLALVLTIGFSFGCVTSIFVAPSLWLLFKSLTKKRKASVSN